MKKMCVNGLTKIIGVLLITGICLLSVASQQHALAAGKDAFRVGVLDPQTVIEKSKAGNRALAALKEHAQARETVMKNDQKELEGLQDELKAADSKDSKLSEEEQKRKQERFAQKYQARFFPHETPLRKRDLDAPT